MKKLIFTLIAANLAAGVFGAIETRPVTFPAEEIPATNPRIARAPGGEYTHIELFAPFKTSSDGSVSTIVAETAITMDAASAAAWLKEARVALGLTVRTWTPLAIKRACGDKWPTVKAALNAADIYEDFIMAQELREDDAAFQQGIAWAKSAYGEEAVDEVLRRAEVAE